MAAIYLSLTPLALIAAKVVGLGIGLLLLARAWPHVNQFSPRLANGTLAVLAVLGWLDAAWDGTQLILVLTLPHLPR